MWRKIASSGAFIGPFFVAAAALGQEGANPASGDKAGWAMGYMLAVLAVILGLAAVCRPGRRSSEIKSDAEEK